MTKALDYTAPDSEIFFALELLASTYCDGHLTVMRFTTNWRILLGPTPSTREYIESMPKGATFREAAMEAIIDLIQRVSTK